jgi:hypothetical protein
VIADGQAYDDVRSAAPGHRRRAVVFLFALLTLAAVAAGAAGPAGAGAPAPALKSPAVAGVSAATATFTVSWSTTPPPAGVTWDVQYREVVSGTPTAGDWRWLAHGTRLPQKPAKGEPGHTYTFRARTVQDATPGGWSTEVSTAVPYDQVTGALFTAKYSNGWRSASASASYLGSTRYASRKGSSATFTFTGRALSLVAPKGSAKGKVQISVRTQTGSAWSSWATVKTLDLYSKTTRNRSLTTVKTWPTAATRQAKFLVTGTKNRRSKGTRVDLDAIVVRDTPHAVQPIVVAMNPTNPTMGFEEQQQFTAEVRHSLDQTVEWHCFRIGNSGDIWLTDEAGSITSAGLYTSTDVPSHDADGYAPVRHYLVQAVSETDPAAPSGSYGTFVTVVPGPGPQVTSLSASSGDEGATITLHGTGFVNHSWQPTVSFSGRDAALVGTPTATQLSVRVPGGWFTRGTTAGCYVWLTTCGQSSDAFSFTVTGLLPSPPNISSVGNQDGLYDCRTGSPGDTLTVYGEGFSHTAAANVFDFGGQTALATSWTDASGSTPERVKVTIPVTAPVGAEMRVKCTDGNGEWSTPPNFTVAARTIVILNASSFAHLIDPAGSNHFASPAATDTWILSGSGFNSLRSRNANYIPGTFAVEITAAGHTWSAEASALSDTTAVCQPGPSIGTLWDAVDAGDTVSVRLSGMELTNGFTRTSSSLSVQVAADAVFGGVHHVTLPFTSRTLELSKGDMLQLDGNDAGRHNITADGFWTGTLPMTGWFAGKLLHFTSAGTYAVRDTDTGAQLTVVVKEGGAADEQWMWWPADDTTHPWWTEDFVMAGGGARVSIPAGTLVPETNYPDYRIGILRYTNGVPGFDPTVGDFGGHYSIQFSAKHLYHPITVTLPYDPAGRFGEPGISLYDAASGVYYQLGGTVDSSAHTVTYTIPAGVYPETMPAGRRVAASAASRRSAPEQAARSAAPADAAFAGAPWIGDQPLPNVPLYKALESTAVVSSNAVSGVLTDEENHIRVEYDAGEASTSYCSPAKAQAILDTAKATVLKLTSLGWERPSGWLSDWIAVKVSNYGDPAAVGGSTTKTVYGQAHVYINSRCATGGQIETATAHEVTHAFQRGYTLNYTFKWIDEAVAEWGAWVTLGSGAQLDNSFQTGPEYAALGIPAGFSAYTEEQAYAAGSFAIWLGKTFGDAKMVNVYKELSGDPTQWYDTYGTLTEAFVTDMPTIASLFGTDYWRQSYDPIKGMALDAQSTHVEYADWNGVTLAQTRPAYSSQRFTVPAASAFAAAQLAGRPLVVRATGLGGSQKALVYGDPASPNAPPSQSMTLLATLDVTNTSATLGAWGAGGAKCYRVIVLNYSDAAAAPQVRLVSPHIASLSPASGSNAGFYPVTINGSGFGAVKGTVTVGGVALIPAAVYSWSDSSITFTQRSVSPTTGAMDVQVQTSEGALSDTAAFTFTP